MQKPDLSTVTDEQLCRSAEMAGNPLMWELARRFREASSIAQAAREAGMVDEQGKLRDFTTASCNTTGVWEQSMLVSGECKVVYFIVPRSAAEAAKGGGDAQ